MSEYQYYEFQAIDTPLTKEQRKSIQSLSSRAHVTSRKASFVYNYSDFPGDNVELMIDYFDFGLYMANWGGRELMFRLPCELVNIEQLETYSLGDRIILSCPESDEHLLLEFQLSDDDLADWTEGEGWCEELIDLREEIIKGDARPLYLAWLKAASLELDEYGYGDEEDEEESGDLREPPVPPGLGELSPSQEALVRFLEIDEALLAVAAKNSRRANEEENLEPLLDSLPVEEQREFLLRLCRGEKNLSAHLQSRLRELAADQTTEEETAQPPGRTISELQEAARVLRDQQKAEQQRKAEAARRRELEAMIIRRKQMWTKAEKLIGKKIASAYGEAVSILKDLRDVAAMQKESKEFKKQLQTLTDTYSNRPALLRRLREAGLLS